MGERERESVSESARRRRSNRDIYTTGRIHWISDRNFCRALTRDRWQFVENLSYPSAPLFAPRVLEIIHRVIIRAKSWTKGRKNANEIRSFPMKIRQGRSVLPFPSLPFQRSNFCFTQLCIREERIFLFSQRGPKFKLPGKRWSEHLLEVTANTREITLILRVARRGVRRCSWW